MEENLFPKVQKNLPHEIVSLLIPKGRKISWGMNNTVRILTNNCVKVKITVGLGQAIGGDHIQSPVLPQKVGQLLVNGYLRQSVVEEGSSKNNIPTGNNFGRATIGAVYSTWIAEGEVLFEAGQLPGARSKEGAIDRSGSLTCVK